MSLQEFVVRIADLDVGPQRIERPVTQEWLTHALADTEGHPWIDETNTRPVGSVDLEVSRSGRQILVRGSVTARVTLPCARTLEPAHYELESKVFLLLSPSPEAMATSRPGAGRRRQRAEQPAARDGKALRDGGTAPTKTKRRGGGDWSDDPELTDEQAATDTFSGEEVLLDGFVREFIVLEFPMFPLREDLRSDPARASCALPSGAEATQLDRDRPLDPRLSPLAELKARLEQKGRLEKKE